MKSRISVVTLGVDDLHSAVHFYKNGLGFATEGIVGEQFENGTVAFFKLTSVLTLAVFERKKYSI